MDTDTPSESDPVADVMGGLDEQFAELSAELEELADLDDVEDDDGPVLPSGFSLFAAKPEAVAKLRDGGRDPRVTAVRVIPIHHGKKGHMCAKYAPDGLTLNALRQALPPGTYDLQGVNQDGLWVGGKRVHVNNAESLDVLPGAAGGGGGGALGDKLLYALAMRGLNGGGADRGSEMEKATAGMIKSMMAMTQMSMLDMKRQMMMADRADNKSTAQQTGTLDMVKTIMGLMQPKRSNGAAANGMGRFEDFFAAMQLGMKLAGGDDRRDEDENSLKSWLLPLADSLGPGLISVVAMMLPAEKAKMVSDLLEAHFKAREAEARSQSDDPPTVDTTGVPVGGDD